MFDKSVEKESSTDKYFRELGQLPDPNKSLDQLNKKIDHANDIIEGFVSFQNV